MSQEPSAMQAGSKTETYAVLEGKIIKWGGGLVFMVEPLPKAHSALCNQW